MNFLSMARYHGGRPASIAPPRTTLLLLFLSLTSLLMFPANVVHGQSEPTDDPPLPSGGIPTMGGMQFWGDVYHWRGWRIQQNCLTSHYRLLDSRDRRHAWGDLATCEGKLGKIRQTYPAQTEATSTVVVLHGLGRTRGSMQGMAEYLQKEGGFAVYNVSYPSTRTTIDEHAQRLSLVLDGLEGAKEVHFVAHSLGNIVLRRYFALLKEQKREPPHPLGRMVMLGPPNRGAALAETMSKVPGFETFFGSPGKELGRSFAELEDKLATPPIEFAIIAGNAQEFPLKNPLLDGESDFIVTVESTELAGAADFAVLPVMHTTIMDDAHVREKTSNFLRKGFLTAEDEKAPLR